MQRRRIIAAVTAAACVLSLAACSRNIENVNSGNSTTPRTEPDTVSDGDGGDVSEDDGDDEEESGSDLSEGEEQVPVEDEEPVEKIPLTSSELDSIVIYWHTSSFLESRQESRQNFDCTVSIDSVDLLDFVIGRLVKIVSANEADEYEVVNIDDEAALFSEEEYYHFTPKTAEKLIRKHFLPSFSINSLDYMDSKYWNEEDRCFRVYDFPEFYNTMERDCILENGYIAGDYYYADAVVYYTPNISEVKLSNVAEKFFDAPRLRLKIKKFTAQSSWDPNYFYDVYVVVGSELLREPPEWLKAAANLFRAFDRESEYYMHSIGVVDGSLGKRLFFFEMTEMGSHNYIAYSICDTYGIRGENDNIRSNWNFHSVTDEYGSTMSTKIVIQDNFNGDTYECSYSGIPSSHQNGSYAVNGREVSEAEYNSAEVVAYFDGLADHLPDDDRVLYRCGKDLPDITLADLYEMAKIIVE